MPRRSSDQGQRADPSAFDASASRSQWLKGVLELAVLSIVCQGEVYGYEIAQRLEAAGLGKIKGGTLYPRLAALEASGQVQTEWREGEHGPGRKYYLATRLGRSMLAESSDEYRRFAYAVAQLLGADETPEPPVASEKPEPATTNNRERAEG